MRAAIIITLPDLTGSNLKGSCCKNNNLFIDTFQDAVIKFSRTLQGDVAESADAADSKSANSDIVRVQVPSSPPVFIKRTLHNCEAFFFTSNRFILKYSRTRFCIYCNKSYA